MRRIRTHRLGVEQGSLVLFSDFQHDGEMWTGAGEREVRKKVTYAERFTAAPAVSVGLSMWDADHTANVRVDISAENVTATDFEIVFRTWGDSRVARVRADWMALGELSDDDEWDVL
jgi:hypothetical protein